MGHHRQADPPRHPGPAERPEHQGPRPGRGLHLLLPEQDQLREAREGAGARHGRARVGAVNYLTRICPTPVFPVRISPGGQPSTTSPARLGELSLELWLFVLSRTLTCTDLGSI